MCYKLITIIGMSISVVIAKPTKQCNADCSYCSTPPDGAPKWTIDNFRRSLDILSGSMANNVEWIWHGGEPMLMGPDFFYEAQEVAQEYSTNFQFSMQTNALAYSSSRWFELFRGVFEGRISTSFEPGTKSRTVMGSSETFDRTFLRAMDSLLSDGFAPLVISTITDRTTDAALSLYEKSVSDWGVDIRINYAAPVGRSIENQGLISPDRYSRVLLELLDRWVRDSPKFDVVPLSQMLRKIVGLDSERCPWTKSCGGRFISINPDGAVFNCSEFADMGGDSYKFGQLWGDEAVRLVGGGAQLMSSPAATDIMMRTIDQPRSCKSCLHFKECEGGCARDSVLFERGMGGKFYYCDTWMTLFAELKARLSRGDFKEMFLTRGVVVNE